MKKKDIICLISGAVLCILFLIGCYSGYPAAWFFHGTLPKVRIQTVASMTNCLIYIVLTTIFGILFGYFKNYKSAFLRYGLVALGVMVISLFGEYLGRRNADHYQYSFLYYVIDGIIDPFLESFAKIYILTLLLGMPLSALPYKHKNIWNALILAAVFLVITAVFRRKCSGMELYYYLSIAFGEVFFASLILYNDHAVITGAVLCGIPRLSYLPAVCYSVTGIPNVTVFIVSIAYLITGSIFFGMLISKEISQSDEKINENA